uniref:Ground-like domain-containing protein n=1 Tax=Caenorhabditis tropicalis TaxID=1561998 RepID=A0A1I7TWJ9_9PELO
MMPSYVFILLLASVAADEYKSQTAYPESAPATTTPQPPPPPPPPKPAPYVEQSAQPPQPVATPAPAPYPQQAVPAPAPAPAPYPQQAPATTQAPYPQHAVPAPAPAPAPYHEQPPPPPPVHYPAPQTVYIQQSAPPPPPPPHPAPHPAYIEHSAPRPAYIEHSAPQPQYLQRQYPQQAPQYPQQHAYNAGPRTQHEQEPYPAKFQYVDYPAPTTRRPYPYPSFEVLPHHEEYQPPSTRRPTTTTERPTTTHKPRPGWGDTEYNYPERTLPLKGCFYNNHGYACCNLRLQTKMEELADELLNNGTFHRCNVQKLANDLQDKVETAFKEDFETVVGLSDFAERIHFREHYVCKIEVNGRYMLAWATPDDHSGARAKRGANATADDIHEYNF